MCTAAAMARTRCRLLEGACIAYDDGEAAWPTSPTNTVNVTGVCAPGYVKTNNLAPLRTCNANSAWGPATNPCTRTVLPVCATPLAFCHGHFDKAR